MKNQIPIYVISTKRTPERRLYIQRQLDALGLEYKIIDAIDKYNLISRTYRSHIADLLDIDKSFMSFIEHLVSRILRKKKSEASIPLSKLVKSRLGILAVLLSHIKIYNLMSKNNIDEACILEDDITLLPSFSQTLEAIPKLSWDILLLASTPSPEARGWLQNKSPYEFISIKAKKNNTLVKRWFGDNSDIKYLLKEYGFNEYQYPNQSEIIAKALQKCNGMFNVLTKGHFLVKANKDLIFYIPYIEQHISSHLGGLADITKSERINDYHCIAPPRAQPHAAMAYCVKKSATEKWKQIVFNKEGLWGVDMFYWELYHGEGVRVRLITPPCVTTAFHYLIYSASCDALPGERYKTLLPQLMQLCNE